ncbi:hypothetical protein E2C01_090171 [Portunus trituberculatus]|uniref:Uncharacterized protein n=1 Tax=Portunus trituberculatus TaxID=210409 RepID=A0A5B7JJJ1_PORTR|nr:hypothetical protein [Portunus trituberculatus]
MTARRLGDSMKLPTRQPVCVVTATINNIRQKLHKKMMVAHSRPPNHTGDYSHLKNNNRDETILRPSASPLNKRDKRKNTGNTAKPATLSPGTNPLLHTVTAKPAANRLLQKEGTTPRPRLLSTQNSLATRVSTLCQDPKSARVHLR